MVIASVMRSLASVTVLYVLAILLVGTSPIGAGQGRHRDQLVDLLLPHSHFPDLSNVAGRRPPPLTADAPSGPAFGAGAGAEAAALGLALTPPLPAFGELLVVGGETSIDTADPAPPRALLEPPPDPPPTSAHALR